MWVSVRDLVSQSVYEGILAADRVGEKGAGRETCVEQVRGEGNQPNLLGCAALLCWCPFVALTYYGEEGGRGGERVGTGGVSVCVVESHKLLQAKQKQDVRHGGGKHVCLFLFYPSGLIVRKLVPLAYFFGSVNYFDTERNPLPASRIPYHITSLLHPY